MNDTTEDRIRKLEAEVFLLKRLLNFIVYKSGRESYASIEVGEATHHCRIDDGLPDVPEADAVREWIVPE